MVITNSTKKERSHRICLAVPESLLRKIEQEASQMSIPNVSLKVREIIAAYFENKED